MILYFSNSIAPLSFPRNNLHLCLFQEIPLIILRCDFFSHSPFHLHIIQPQTQVGEVEDPSGRFKRPRFLGENRCHIFHHNQYDHCCHILSQSMIIVAIFYHDQYGHYHVSSYSIIQMTEKCSKAICSR